MEGRRQYLLMWACCGKMRLVALVVVCGLIVGQDGGSVGAALPGYDSAQQTRATGG